MYLLARLLLRSDILVIALLVCGINAFADNIKGEYTEIQWTDLIPKADLEALNNPPESLKNIKDGSAEDQLASQLKIDLQSDNSRYAQALASTQIKQEYNNKKVKIPGFIVPLDFDDDLTITSFFLVPYFGACIHTPPPPPNQIIYASFTKGLKLTDLIDPFWLEGTLTTDVESNELGTAAYSIAVKSVLPYTE